jgi:hypothetical protein
MKYFRHALPFFALLICAFAFTMTAEAQATRTWVSGVGDDVNPCSRTAPCKTFAGAITKTATNGEINCLDPGGFGAVTITKSITIDCTTDFGSILASSVNGIVINITLATDTAKSVRLRGLAINGASTGLNGIRVISANRLVVEDTVIDGFTTHGISLENSATTVRAVIRNSSIRNNVGNGINGFFTGTGSGQIFINGTNLSGNNIGVNMSNGSSGMLSDSHITANTTGVQTAAGVTYRISGNVISGNTTGVSPSGGSLISLGNNTIRGNTSNGVPSSTEALN